MTGAGLSRWTMAHVAAALTSLLLAEAAMAAGLAYPVGDLRAPLTFAVVHLVTIGWLSLLILGALYQFVPVLVGKPLFSQQLSLASLIALVLGLCGMTIGFVALSSGDAAFALSLPTGGSLVVAGFAAAVVNLGGTLLRGRPLPVPARFVAAGLACLTFTAGLGLLFACALTDPFAPAWTGALLARGLSAHVAIGLGGWFTLTAMGVSYRLLSMFMLAPEASAKRAPWVLRAAVAGLIAIVAGATVPGAAAPVVGGIGAALCGAAVSLYIVDVRALYRARCRRKLELNSKAAAAAIAVLAAATAALGAAQAAGLDSPSIVGAGGFLFLFGWLSGLGLSQIYKIVPFLTWLERFGSALGRSGVPRVQDLVDERRAAPWYVVYFAAVLAAAVAMAAAVPAAAQAAIAVQLAATAFIARELWRARHPRIAPAAAQASESRKSPATQEKPHAHRTAHT